jgi:hypothetical protein
MTEPADRKKSSISVGCITKPPDRKVEVLARDQWINLGRDTKS